MIDPKDPQSIANNPDAIRVLALEAKKDLGPLLQVVAQAVVLHDLDPMWLEYVARHYAEAHEDIPVPLEIKLGPREFIFELATDGFDADTAERFSQWYADLSQHNG